MKNFFETIKKCQSQSIYENIFSSANNRTKPFLYIYFIDFRDNTIKNAFSEMEISKGIETLNFVEFWSFKLNIGHTEF